MSVNIQHDHEKPLPPLKAAIEAVQIEHEGKPMILLRDQEGLAEKAVALSPPGFVLALLLNGRHSLETVRKLFSKNTGTLISPEEVSHLVNRLKESHLLETEVLKEKRARVLKEFKESSLRKAAHQGTVYPEKTLDLATQLGKYFRDPKGPGREFNGNPGKTVAPLGVVAPHIDFARGGPAYAWVYQALSNYPPPDFIVGLGVAHMSPNSPWIFTDKHYETPYGPLRVSRELYRELGSNLWYDPKDDEWAHRAEHSLEFQALWLKYLWKDKTPPWVPILCSAFDRFCPEKPPSTVSTIEQSINGMGALLKARRARGERVMILAGVDLAHVGPRFGDELQLNAGLEEKVKREDLHSLDLACRGEADSFYESVVAGSHWRKVCGLSALYTAVRLMTIVREGEPLQGEVLAYDQARDPLGGIVSYASMIFPQ